MNVLVSTTCTPDDRKTLSVVRSLGAAGVRVVVASDRIEGQATSSRFSSARARVPDPRLDETAYLDALLEIAAREQIDVILPTQSETTLPLARNIDRLAGRVAAAVPALASLEVADNKSATLELARATDVAVPRTWQPMTLEELDEISPHLPYPMVVKPDRGFGAFGLWLASGRKALRRGWQARYRDSSASDAPLIQEFIPGLVHDACFVFRRGEPVAALTQVRTLMYPSSGGGGILNETTHDPELAELGARLLRALRWHGPAQVEFKRHAVSGRPVLMEINGRLWGTVDLAKRAGIDVPAILCRVALDRPVESPAAYRVGLRYRWPFPYALLHAWENGTPLRAVRDFLLPARATCSDLRITDPFPHLAEVTYAARRMWRRGSLHPGRTSFP